MSHALAMKHLLNKVAYWNESCPSDEAFIGQLKSHTEMSHALAMKRLLEIKVAYWNESCPSDEAFIGQQK